MGKEQPASYYDAAYKTAKEYQKPWQQSRYLKVWERMVQRFDKSIPVIDLGCGVGQTAEMLHANDFLMYLGVDFSAEAILKAKAIGLSEDYNFLCLDLFRFVKTSTLDEEIQIFCSETLEHIHQDVALIELLKTKFPGSRIAISVPTFDDPSHVRHFKSPSEVKLRYCPYIKVEDMSQIGPWIILQGKLLE
jgi:SAM-dependent methyltransferase